MLASGADPAYGQPPAQGKPAPPAGRQPPAPGKSPAVPPRPPATPAQLFGKVTSDEGQPLAEADVLLTRVGEPHKRHDTETGKDGTFTLKNVEPGSWVLKIYAEKMLAKTQKITLAPGQELSVTVALEPVEGAETLKIKAKRRIINAEKTRNDTPLDKTFITNYKSGNKIQDLLTSTPGILNDSYGNIITRGEHNAVNYVLDGVVLPEAAGVLQQQQFVSPRSLQSMDVAVGGYSAADGGGPLGSVVNMRSMPIQAKPQLDVGGQIGGPLAGTIYYYASTALSQDPKSILNRIRIESTGTNQVSTINLQAGTKHFRRNTGFNLNNLSKIEFRATERDTLKATVGINEAFLQIPISGASEAAGVREHQHERQDFFIVSWNHKYDRKIIDESNLHIVNSFNAMTFRSRNVFDPDPIINGDNALLQSVAPQARRFDYALSVQGDASKTILQTHHLKAGFLSELRPVRTSLSAFYYNNSLTNGIPYGAIISPFTGQPGGPNLQGHIGNYKGFRYLQSAYVQDHFTPRARYLKRLTLDSGVRVDVYHGVFGNTLGLAQTLATIPGIPPLDIQPFLTQRVTDAQASGRFGASYLLTRNTVLRGSYSQLFEPPPVDIFVNPPDVTSLALPGIFTGTPRPLRAARGQLVDTNIEQAIGSRFAARTSLYYKQLQNMGDSGVIANTPIYNRLTLNELESYGVETRLDLKPGREGTGLYGFLTNTVQVAYLRDCKCNTGGVYQNPSIPVLAHYADHDRRYSLQAGLGYRAKSSLWFLAELGFYTGLQDQRDPTVFGAHPARTPPLTLLGLNFGYTVPSSLRKSWLVPASVDVRMQNLLNQRIPVNLGSPYQGTRYSLPLRVLAGAYWKV